MKKKATIITTIIGALITLYGLYNHASFIQNPKIILEVNRKLEEDNLIEVTENKKVIDRINSNGFIVYVVEINTTDATYYAFIEKRSTIGFNINYQMISIMSSKGEIEVGNKNNRFYITGIKTNDSITKIRLFLKYSETSDRFFEIDISGKRYFFYYAEKNLTNGTLIDFEWLEN